MFRQARTRRGDSRAGRRMVRWTSLSIDPSPTTALFPIERRRCGEEPVTIRRDRSICEFSTRSVHSRARGDGRQVVQMAQILPRIHRLAMTTLRQRRVRMATWRSRRRRSGAAGTICCNAARFGRPEAWRQQRCGPRRVATARSMPERAMTVDTLIPSRVAAPAEPARGTPRLLHEVAPAALAGFVRRGSPGVRADLR